VLLPCCTQFCTHPKSDHTPVFLKTKKFAQLRKYPQDTQVDKTQHCATIAVHEENQQHINHHHLLLTLRGANTARGKSGHTPVSSVFLPKVDNTARCATIHSQTIGEHK